MEKIGLSSVLDISGFTSGASAYNKALDGLVGATTSAGNVISAAFSTALGMLSFQALSGAINSVTNSVKSFIIEAMAGERVAMNLDAALRSSGGRIAREQIDEIVQSLTRLTEYDDKAVMGAAAIALQFDNIGSEVFPEVMRAAADLAARMGVDLTTATQQLGIALEQPGESLGRLKRYGVAFEKQEIEMLKAMNETGRGAEAQRIILDRLAKSIGGAAEAIGQTASGKIKILKNAIDTAKETIGRAFLPVIALVAGSMTDLVVKSMPDIEAFASRIASRLSVVSRAFGEFFSTLQKTGFGVGGIVTAIEAGLETVFGDLDHIFLPIQDFINVIYPFRDILADMFAGVGVNVDWVSELIQDLGIGAPIADALASALGKVGDAIAAAREAAQGGGLFAGLLAGMETLGLGDLAEKIRVTFEVVRSSVVGVISQIGPIVQANIGPLLSMFGALGQLRFEGLLVGLRSLASLIPSIAGLVSAALPVAIDLFKQFQTIVMQAGQGILSSFTPIIARLVQVITANIPQIGSTFRTAFGVIQQAINTALPIVANFASRLVEAFQRILPIVLSVIQQIGQTISSIITYIAPVMQYVGTMVIGAITQLAPIVGRVIGEILRIVRDNMPLIATILKTVADIFAIVLPEAMRVLGKVVETVLPAIRFVFENVLRIILALVQSFLKVLQGDWQGAWDTLKDAAVRFASELVNVWNNLAPQLRKVGEDIIAGLREGLNSAWGSVRAWFADTVAQLPEWVKKIFGISSPSTVFAKIGIDMMLGLAEGLREGQVAVINEISGMLKNLSEGLASIFALARDWGSAGLPVLPDLAGWFERAKWSIKEAVDAINIFFDVERWVSVQGLSYAAIIAGEINKLFTALVVDWSQFEVPRRVPDVALFVRAVVRAVSEIVAELERIPESVVEGIARTMGLIPALLETLTLLGVSLEVKAPPVNFAQIFDAWLNALAYAGLSLISNVGRAGAAIAEAVKKTAELAPMIKTIMELLSVSLEIKSPPAGFRGAFDAWLDAFGYVGIALVTRMGRAEEMLVEAVKKTAELAPLVKEIVGLIATNLAVKAPPANLFSAFEAWLEAFGHIGITLVARMGRASAELVSQIEKVASIVVPIKEIFSLLGVEFAELKLPEDIPAFMRDLETYLVVLVEIISQVTARLANGWSREVLENIAQFGQTVGAIMQGFQSAIGVFSGLANLVLPSENAINDFVQAIRISVFEPLYRFASDLNAEQLAVTQKVGEVFGALFGGLKDAFDILRGVRNYVEVPQTQIDLFFEAVRTLFMRMYEEASSLNAETLSLTQKVGEVFTSLFSGLKSALELFSGVSIYEAVNADRLNAFLEDVKGLFNNLYNWIDNLFVSLGNSEMGAMLSRMAEWATSFKGIVEVLSGALEFVHGVTGYAGASEEIGRFLYDFKDMFDRIVAFSVSPEVRAAMPLILDWGNVMRAFFDVLDFVGNVLGKLHTVQFPGGLIDTIAQMFTSLGVAIERATPEVRDAAQRLGGEIINALPTAEEMFDVGHALGTGLASGISSVIPIIGLGVSENGMQQLSDYFSANNIIMQHIADLILSVQDLRTTIDIRGRIDVPAWMLTGTLSDQVKQGEAISATLAWVSGS